MAVPTVEVERRPKLLVKILRFPLVRIILGAAACGFVPFALGALWLEPDQLWRGDAAGASSALLLTAILLLTYWGVFRLLEARPISELSLRPALWETSWGLVAGFGLVAAVIATLSALGSYRIVAVRDGTGLLPAFLLLIFFAALEEILFRGILYRIVEESLGTAWALALSGLLFGFAHAANPSGGALGTIATGEAGVFLGLLLTATGRLWVPIALHIGWNFAQVFFGTPVSGINAFNDRGLFAATLSGPGWLSGAGFGPENSAVSILIVLLAIVGTFRQVWRNHRLVPPFWRHRTIAKSNQPTAADDQPPTS